MPPEPMLLALAAGALLGGALVGGLTYLHLAVERNTWREMWKTEARLRAQDRVARAGEMDHYPFHAPALRTPKRRVVPGFLRRWRLQLRERL